MTRPALAILVHDLSSSGVVRNAVRIANAMAGQDLETEVWTVRPGGSFASTLSARVKVRLFVPPIPSGWRRADTVAAAPAMAKAVGQIRPRVLFSAGNHFHLAAGLVHRLAGRPADTCLMGRSSNAPPNIDLPLIGTLAHAVDARKYAGFEKVIAVSHELGERLVQDLGLRPEQIVVIPNGVNLKNVQSRAAGPLDDPWFADGAPPVIMGAGRLSRQKNFELLIQAFAQLRRKREARLVILGEGTAKAKSQLQSLADSLGIAADLRLHGFEANPMRYFANAALFVLSSRWEGMSNVVLEALACGCPVVATGCPTGVREQLDNGRIGPVVPVDNPQALAEAMQQRMDAPRDSATLQGWVAGYSDEKTLESYYRLISAAAAQKGP